MGTTATLLLDAANTDVDDVLTCTVTATDDQDTEITSSSNMTVLNTAPEHVSIYRSNSDIQSGDTIACNANGLDADGEGTNITYSWMLGETELQTGPLYTADGLQDGDEVTCVATITDEPHQDATSQSTSITLINTPPLMTGVTLTATPGTDNGNALYKFEILCEAEGYSDIDGDDLVPTYSWTVDGSLSAETSDTLSGTFDVGTEIVCEIQSNDGKGRWTFT